MNEKEEKNIDLKQTIEEKRLKIRELLEDELAKVSGGNGNGVVFEKGKWLKLPIDEPGETIDVFELTELKGDEMILTIWSKVDKPHIGKSHEHKFKVFRIPGLSLPIQLLNYFVEIPRPDWAHE